MSKLIRFLYHIYFDQEQESKVPVQVDKLAEQTVICSVSLRTKKSTSFLILSLLLL